MKSFCTKLCNRLSDELNILKFKKIDIENFLLLYGGERTQRCELECCEKCVFSDDNQRVFPICYICDTC